MRLKSGGLRQLTPAALGGSRLRAASCSISVKICNQGGQGGSLSPFRSPPFLGIKTIHFTHSVNEDRID